MLAAMLMLGFLPFAFVIDKLENGESMPGDPSADPTSDPPVAGGQSAPPDMAILDTPDQDVPEEMPGPLMGEDFVLGASGGETTLPGFRPGTDSLSIDVEGEGGSVWVELEEGEDGASLSLFSEDAESPGLRVQFEGLDEVPVDDISLRTVENGQTVNLGLSDLINDALSRLGPSSDGGGIDPVGPDETGAASPGSGEQGLDPVDPDFPGEAGSDDFGPGLDPVDPDSEAGGLDPVDPEYSGEPGPDDPDPGLDPVDPDYSGEAGPADPDPGLDPVDPGAATSSPSDASAISGLIARDSDWTDGAGTAATVAGASGATISTQGAGDDDLSLDDDGLNGTGEGELAADQGGPVIGSTNGVAIVDGGAGDDTLQAGDQAAYLFGGDGADEITGGEGVLAGYGGAGDDALTAGTGAAYLDGGVGDDVITGSDADDILYGGSHGATPGGSDVDNIDAGAGDDTLRGGHGADRLEGGDGDDVIDHFGRAGDTSGEDAAGRFAAQIDGADDTLSGGAGNDTLIFDGSDTASGGTGADLFWLHHDAAGAGGVAEITDFETGTDMLRISLNPDAGHGAFPDYEVETSANGQDAEVRVDGNLIAVLRGASDATASDVFVEIVRDGIF